MFFGWTDDLQYDTRVIFSTHSVPKRKKLLYFADYQLITKFLRFLPRPLKFYICKPLNFRGFFSLFLVVSTQSYPVLGSILLLFAANCFWVQFFPSFCTLFVPIFCVCTHWCIHACQSLFTPTAGYRQKTLYPYLHYHRGKRRNLSPDLSVRPDNWVPYLK